MPVEAFVRILTAAGPQWALRDANALRLLTGSPFAGGEPSGDTLSLEGVRLLAPIDPGSKVICFGKTYPAHVAEMGWVTDLRPTIFLKPASAIIGPGDAIVLPIESSRVEPEGELAVVVGRRLRRASPQDSADSIAGYTLANDVSARDLMSLDGQWTRGKGFDTFLPLGPAIITGLDHTREFRIRTRIRDREVQNGSTGDLLWGLPELLSMASQSFTLNPGDVVLTGSPSGRAPLVEGSEVAVGIPELGELINPVVAESPVTA